MTKMAIRGPLRVLDLSDELGSHEMSSRCLRPRERPVEGARVLCQRLEIGEQPAPRRIGESGADLAHVAESPFVGDTQEEGSEAAGALAASLCPAAYHHLLSAEVLHLHPVAVPRSGLVLGAAPLRNDPFQSPSHGGLDDAFFVRASERRWGRKGCSRKPEAFEEVSTLVVGELVQELSFEVEDVEVEEACGHVVA